MKNGPCFLLEDLNVSLISNYINECTKMGLFPRSASETFSCVISFTAINILCICNHSELVAPYFSLLISLEIVDVIVIL